ncbi:unnamed protein product [Cochlearia groenlandica]
MAQRQNSPQRPQDHKDSRPHDPTDVMTGSVDTVTIGEALEATALSLGDKPVDHKDAAAIQEAETRATGEVKTRPGALAVAAHAAAVTNEGTVLEEAKVTIEDILTDAAENLPGDKVVSSEDAAAVVGAELRNSAEMKTTPGGVAESMSAGSRLNQQL